MPLPRRFSEGSRRLIWFATLWLLGVTALAAIGFLIRTAIIPPS
jgi:hypothetical protein